MSGEVALRVRVRGRVQGVGFRAWTKREARARGLAGWVRNEADGSVAALISGPTDRVPDMVAALHRGPPLARVDRVETHPAMPPDAPGFDVLK
jgi:acylphosphatase